jgi:hypothetical protein
MNEESLFGIVENVAENDIKDDTSSAKSGPSTTRSGLQKVKTMSNMSDMSVKMSDSFKGAAKLDTGRDFLDWLVRMESNIQAEKNSHFNVYYDRICELSTSTKELQEQVDKGIEVLEFLRDQNSSASTKSNNLHNVCDELMTKMSSLNELKNEIEAKENVFKDADKSIAQSNHTLNPESLCKLLDAIDQCLRFFRAHTAYKDSGPYEIKCRAAASKVLVFVKDFFRSSLQRNVDMQQQSSSTSPASADTSFDLFYGRLKMTAPRFQGLMSHLANCPHDSPLTEEFDTTLQECNNIFIASRQRLVIKSLEFTLDESVKKFERDHCSLVRSASVSLYHLLRDEENLLQEFFPTMLSPAAQ